MTSSEISAWISSSRSTEAAATIAPYGSIMAEVPQKVTPSSVPATFALRSPGAQEIWAGATFMIWEARAIKRTRHSESRVATARVRSTGGPDWKSESPLP